MDVRASALFRGSLRLTAAFVLSGLFFSIKPTSLAYSLEGKKWPMGSVVTFQLELGAAGRTLLDGNTSWDIAAAPAANAWDNVVGRLQFRTAVNGSAPVSTGDGVNVIVFASSVFGQNFGSNTLAVTYYRSSGTNMTEADVLFNNHQNFDSYRGALRYGANTFAIGDIRRVLVHELGHALGLDHPDTNGQHVDAIMNSVTGNRETLSPDDTAGAQSMYGSAAPSPTPTPSGGGATAARFTNISTRLKVGTGNNVLIGGFTISGSQSKTVIVRALGPTLASFGVDSVLDDPALELHDSSGALLASNDDWQSGAQVSQISATAYTPANGREAAIMATLAPGAYTAVVRGDNSTSGVALVEIYGVDSGTSRLSNLSTRGHVGTGDDVLIGGIIVAGSSNKRMIVRAIGPTLAAPPFSLVDTLGDPTVEIRNAAGTLLSSNDNWQIGPQAAAIASSGYAPRQASEAAIIASLPAGNYTAIVRGANETSGVALMDIYDLDP